MATIILLLVFALCSKADSHGSFGPFIKDTNSLIFHNASGKVVEQDPNKRDGGFLNFQDMLDELRKRMSIGELYTEALDGPCPVRPRETVDFGSSTPPEVQDALQRVTAFLESFRQSNRAPGSYASIVYRGETIYSQGLGQADLRTGQSPTQDTAWRIGSVTKLFAVLGALKLREIGRLDSLSDPVSKYVPEFSVLDPSGTKSTVTFHQLMSLLSGLPREFRCPGEFTQVCNVPNSEAWRAIADTRLKYDPYTQPSYSNLAFSILGHATGDYIYGKTFEELIDTEILGLLGMNRTGHSFTPDVQQYLAKGYFMDPFGRYIEAQLIDIGWSRPAGQMYSTGRDMDRLLKSLLDMDDSVLNILSRDTRRELMLPQWMMPDVSTFFGSPWEIKEQNSYLVRRKVGNIDGYSAVSAVVPELEIGVNMFWNFGLNTFEASDGVFDILLPAFNDYLIRNQPIAPLPPNINRYLGRYTIPDFPGQSVQLTSSFGRLWLQQDFAYLEHVEGETFQLRIVPDAMECIQSVMSGQDGSFAYFQTNPFNGAITGFEIPGLMQRFQKAPF